ncbi:hypothetical protein CYY_008027 [Polysphondylium violaceum]|uniref:Uncharacterized protein n=1 Tax=Polysphondylium violaceum TaxID=133409 RepID=A0A8J4V4E4_9MYCE|nr:hypothetical protein CYY_008027 [Polysphondylium violaceum]
MNSLFKSLRSGPLSFKPNALYITRAHRHPLDFNKDGKYDGPLPELIELEPENMAVDLDEQLERDPSKHSSYFFKFFGVLICLGVSIAAFANPNNKQVVERDLPFNNLYLEYGGDPNQTPDEEKWRVKHNDRQAEWRANHSK